MTRYFVVAASGFSSEELHKNHFNLTLYQTEKVMNIRHEHHQNKGIFFVQEQDRVIAELTYHDGEELTMIIDHTEVDTELNGRGIGAKLVLAAVDYARENHLLITPKCSFAKSVFLRKPELSSVLS